MPIGKGIGIAKVQAVIAEQQTWERAEVVRSASEALHTPDEQLIGDETNLARYLNPPMHTVYPLEYAYALLGDIAQLFPGEELKWDGPNMRFTNHADATKLLTPRFREGWTL